MTLVACTLALHVGAGIVPELQDLRVIAKINANFVQDHLRIGLDLSQAFLVEKHRGRDLSRDERELIDFGTCPVSAPLGTPAF